LYNLYYDINPGDVDYMYGVIPFQDYVILPKWTQGQIVFYTSGGAAFGIAGSYYAFGADGLTISQLRTVVYYY
jgi:hypothetical protein